MAIPDPSQRERRREIRGPEKVDESAEEDDRARHVPAREAIVGPLGARAVHNALSEPFDQDGAGDEDRNPEPPAVTAEEEEPQ